MQYFQPHPPQIRLFKLRRKHETKFSLTGCPNLNLNTTTHVGIFHTMTSVTTAGILAESCK